ncbi:peptidoglycan editing factor PgeF [Geobacter sp. SVR]|uniref:peptidoglycan editing factor PgeF n=1 Tax=Geobacter sp. SVR TaxID=2495594 RepID=UPI00143F013C|nr:peptidoglycan editing factor PgeF [Geobacter sp. SVR]BCS51756.1 laccase domain protein [Geobacter sp. SVR]GCF84943.1 laccase domain protein [Geobacter sp. SVR]
MQMKRNGRIHYIAPEFGTSPCSIQGFTTRHEGVSRPPYNSLNLGTNTLDPPHNVEGNRSLLARAFDVAQDQLVTVRQSHGSDILVIDEPNQDYAHFLSVESDAIMTNQPGVMIGVCVADCAPVLLVDPEKRVVAAVHAGWKGTAAGLVSKTVAGMKALFDCNATDIRAAIGPCIGTCCYEVDTPVKQAFLQGGIHWEGCAEPSGDGKWRLSLSAANRELLRAAGVPDAAVQVSEMCVCCQRELFFSYRRDGGETGRQMGFIMLQP